VGPATMRVLGDALDRTKKLPNVDPKRIGVYGHSRGAMAASLLAVRREDLRASVLAAGIYDFLKAFCEAPDAGIRDNMALETGMRDAAIRVRSSILEMDKLRAPILLLHGEKDVNVSVGQALVLRDRLTQLGKPFEVHIYPDLDHAFNAPHVTDTIVAFLKKNL
ncbi:MAG TPA: prolyl oligopeptidase family serine peptidase, partial [Thermoanaerobaculia bacterium]